MARSVVKVWAPATISDLGIGHDILGCAIEGLGDEVLLKRVPENGLKITSVTGAKGNLSVEPSENPAAYAAQLFIEAHDLQEEGMEMQIRKKMPVEDSLGWFASTAIAGVFAVHELYQMGMHKKALLPFVVKTLEHFGMGKSIKHAAPSLLGGMILVRNHEALDFHKLYIPRAMQAVVIVPMLSPKLTAAIDVQKPAKIDWQKHTQQTADLGSLMLGMNNSDFELIRRSLHDNEIDINGASIPGYTELQQAAIKAGVLGFSISGHGPTMVAITNNSLVSEVVTKAAKDLYKVMKIKVKTYTCNLDQEGAYLF